MSVALETAAGVFAAVGVADVLVRTGRELYSFLRDIKDGPKELARLQEVIQETLILHQASTRCHKKLEARADTKLGDGTLHALDSASRALFRALQNLKQLIGKFKGIKTWARVKFVLNEAKVGKAISNLEQTKTLLANALVLASCELAGLGDAQVEDFIRERFQESGVQISEMFQSLDNSLDIHHRTLLKAQYANQQTLISELEKSQKKVFRKQDRYLKTLDLVQQTQVNVLQRQDKIARLVGHTQKQNAAIMRRLEGTNSTNTRSFRGTPVRLDRHTGLAAQDSFPEGDDQRAKRSGRDVFFLGERQDQILAYLLLLRDDLDYAIDFTLSQHSGQASPSDVEWLRSEVEHLIGSASQENALRYTNSTATPTDQWLYPKDTVRYLRSVDGQRRSSIPRKESLASRKNNRNSPKRLSRKHRNHAQRTWVVSTRSGDIEITLPDRQASHTEPKAGEEVGFSCTVAHLRSIVQIRARFLRDCTHASQPRICSQLNVFVLLKDDSWRAYGSLLKSGSLQDIDSALRKGTISPFHLGLHGDNLLLWHVAFNGRLDVLRYLETQGIGQIALNHDSSILSPLSLRASYETKSFIMKAAHHAADVSLFAIRTALICVADCEVEDHDLFVQCLRLLHQDVFEKAEKTEFLDCFPQRDLSQDCNSASQLVALLVRSGASVLDETFCTCAVWRVLMNRTAAWYRTEEYIEILSTLINAGAHVDFAGAEGISTSMCARLYDSWEVWCGALSRTGTAIQDLVSKEGNAWLLGDDWRKVWRSQRYAWYGLVPSDDDDLDACHDGQKFCSSGSGNHKDATNLEHDYDAVEKRQRAKTRRRKRREEMEKIAQLEDLCIEIRFGDTVKTTF